MRGSTFSVVALSVAAVGGGCVAPTPDRDGPDAVRANSAGAGSASRAAVRRDKGRVWIDDVPPAEGRGNGYVRGLQTLLAHAGTPVAYERLMGLSGLAFIAQADTEHRWEGKVDVGWWPLDAWGLDLRLAFLERALGVEFERIGALPRSPAELAAVRDGLPEFFRDRIAPRVRQAIEAGHPLLATCDFGVVVTGYDDATDKPPVFGRCACDTEGGLERLGWWPTGLLALGRRTAPLDRAAADVAALRYAVALAHDRAGPFGPLWRDRRFTGWKAFAAWASLLRNTDEPVEDRHHANMRGNLRWNRTAAAAYLREVAGRCTGEAAVALERAATAYETALEQIVGMSTNGLAQSTAKRRQLADAVDRVAAAELEAARHMERAVKLMTVTRDGGKVWVDGVAGFDAGEYASSVHGSQARMLEALGESLTYEDLICYSGFAFRVGLHEQMCPSAGHPCCGFMCMENSQRALPWKLKTYDSFPDGPEKPDRAAFEAEACAAIKASIDRGVPVHYGSEEDGLIVGYADDGRRWLCLHPYHRNGTETFWHDEARGFAGGTWPWAIVVWFEPKSAAERVADRDLTLTALKQAVEMWRTEKRGAYFCGETAYARWLQWLRGVEAGRVEDPKAGMQGNGWCYDVLLHSRTIASRWLRRKATGFDGEARKQLLAATDRYAALAEGLIAGLTCSWDLALPPGRFEDWTSAMRQDELSRLEAARVHDRAAIAAIERALLALSEPGN